MKNSKIFFMAGTLMTALLLVACKPSEEKLNEAEATRGALIEAKNNAENTYLDITDSSLRGLLDQLAEKEADIEKANFNKMSDSMIDIYLLKVNELSEEYATVQQALDAILSEENAKREEMAKNAMISAYILNDTEYTLTEVVLHDITSDVCSANLLGEGVALNSGYSLMGVDLEINNESTEWEMLLKDEDGNTYAIPCGDFKQVSPEGICITLKYDSGAGIGSADLENY